MGLNDLLSECLGKEVCFGVKDTRHPDTNRMFYYYGILVSYDDDGITVTTNDGKEIYWKKSRIEYLRDNESGK